MRKQKELYCKFQLKKSKMMQNKLEREKIFLGNKRDSKESNVERLDLRNGNEKEDLEPWLPLQILL